MVVEVIYQAARERGADTVIPPRRDAVRSSDPVLADRDAHLAHIESVGRRRWRVEARQHLQARAENTFCRFQRAFGAGLRARHDDAQRSAVVVACNVLNRMWALGESSSVRVSV
jgi:hypothetical protein